MESPFQFQIREPYDKASSGRVHVKLVNGTWVREGLRYTTLPDLYNKTLISCLAPLDFTILTCLKLKYKDAVRIYDTEKN